MIGWYPGSNWKQLLIPSEWMVNQRWFWFISDAVGLSMEWFQALMDGGLIDATGSELMMSCFIHSWFRSYVNGAVLDWFPAVWIGAITLFFHRWGKIRMLLPYQPVFKEEEPLGGLPSQASPSMAAQHTLQQQRILNNTNKFSSSHPLGTSVSSTAATARRNQFMVPVHVILVLRGGGGGGKWEKGRRPWRHSMCVCVSLSRFCD